MIRRDGLGIQGVSTRLDQGGIRRGHNLAASRWGEGGGSRLMCGWEAGVAGQWMRLHGVQPARFLRERELARRSVLRRPWVVSPKSSRMGWGSLSVCENLRGRSGAGLCLGCSSCRSHCRGVPSLQRRGCRASIGGAVCTQVCHRMRRQIGMLS